LDLSKTIDQHFPASGSNCALKKGDNDDNDDNDEAYKTYIKKMLDEIHQHPLKNHKKQEAAKIQLTNF
jgi:hypothetical protein